MANSTDPIDPPPTEEHASTEHIPDAFSSEMRAPNEQAASRIAAVKRIGPYHILELLGEGGMGEVYKAERRHPMRQLVALKIIKFGFNSREVIARFDSERQALARMDHPNVARVMDAGISDDGRPFFVMEYVPALPISNFADENKFPVRDRLLLFVQACEAINHAHTKAIIHRDIKSTNVLAYTHDGKPTVKVIDFGIAKALTGDRLTDQTFNTGQGKVIGTWESMSPEQAAGSADIDTRTDVYSLGVLLYELLAGVAPFDRASFVGASEDEIRRIIREVEPPRPSTRLITLGESAGDVAKRRREPLEALAKELRVELDWIPLKAIRKERERRYASALQLRDDIINYLNHRPLIAGPESRAYRLRKFSKRHRKSIVAVATMLLVILLGIAGTTYWYVRAEGHRAAAARTLDALLGRLNDDAIAHLESGELSEAEADLSDGVDRAVRELGRNDPTTLGLMNNYAFVLKKEQLLDEAEPYYREVLRRRQSTLGADDPQTLYSLNNLGGLLLERGDPKSLTDAEPMLREALETSSRVLKDDDRLKAYIINNYATLLRKLGRFDEAISLFKESLSLRRRFAQPDDPGMLEAVFVLAQAYRSKRMYADAEPLCKELYEIAPRAQISAGTAAVYMSGWGVCLAGLGRYSEAESPLVEAHKRLTETSQADHAAMDGVLWGLVKLYENSGRTDDATMYDAQRAQFASRRNTTRLSPATTSSK